MRTSLTAAVVIALGLGCTPRAPAPGRLLTPAGESPLPGDLLAARGLTTIGARIDGGLTLLGASPVVDRAPGEKIPVALFWRVDEAIDLASLKVFVHLIAPGGESPLAQADHALDTGGAVPAPGDVIEDTFHVVVPRDFPVDRALVRAGLYAGKKRFAVDEGAHDGQNRVEIAAISVPGAGPTWPVYVAPKAAAAVVVDGVLDDAVWARAPVSAPFLRHDGRGRMRHTTTMQMAWDDAALYVAFSATDTDVHTPYTKRDDPLYESEAVEVFIDADGDKDVYVELQSAPNDVHFDAAFAGGRRKNFDTTYDVEFSTKTIVDGTLNDPSDTDRGFVSEWRIPLAEIRDVVEKPAPGVEWKVNLFRLDRARKGEKVVSTEASAWSSPFSGDFHNLDRMGTLRFGE